MDREKIFQPEQTPGGGEEERAVGQTGAVAETIAEVRGAMGVPESGFVQSLQPRGDQAPREVLANEFDDDDAEPLPIDPEAIPAEATWLRPKHSPINWLETGV